MISCWGDAWGTAWGDAWLTEPQEEPTTEDESLRVCWQIWETDGWVTEDDTAIAPTLVGVAVVGIAVVGGILATIWTPLRPCQNDLGQLSYES